MSSLIRRTDDLLQQKAVQSSHYERLERQLLDRERRRRAAVMALKQSIADVERRGNDVDDLRRENRQLADQLAQHALQLAALQCRNSEAQKAQKAAMERMQDGVRSWSGHPAQIVLILQALQAQKKLSTSARNFLWAVQAISCTLQLHRNACAFYYRCLEVTQWHHTRVAQLTACVGEKAEAAAQARNAALREADDANTKCAGPLTVEQRHVEKTRFVLESQLTLLTIYADGLNERCEMAKGEVSALSDQVDVEAKNLAEWGVKLEATNAAVTQSSDALAVQRESHSHAVNASILQQKQLTIELTEIEEATSKVQTCVRQLSESRDGVQRHIHTVLRQVLVVDFVSDLCGHLRQRCAAQQSAQMSERISVEQELMQLRTQHANRLRELRMAHAAVAQHHAREALLRKETQLRNATVDLEGDEWRLLHAQLVRDACRARAEAAAAEAATKLQSSVKSASAAVHKDAAVPHVQPGKRPRGGGRAATRTSAASRRQRAALEAVDAMTLTTSQGGCHPTSQVSSSVAASHTPRTTYRFVSLKPSLSKKSPPAAAASADAAQAPPKLTKHANMAAAISPFTAALSESDSSISLMHDSSVTEAGVSATATQHNAATAREGEPSGLRVSSPSPSPSPRCPEGRGTNVSEPAPKKGSGHHTAAAALPRRRPQEAAGPDVQRAPRSALDSALMAARTPRSTTVGSGSPMAYKQSFTSGNLSAMPARGGVVGATHTRVGLFPPLRPRAPVSCAGRRRVLPLMPSAGGAADDLFADVFL
ncbi:hypothetical protein ABL78_7340 [Leptomonas seymouri]|uniref:Uncharacterized protein n=1 Tax=Leptomonas seymouri TaxID=5684 RepID=A0A0N0P321_LEPSE|nr:hypothetical protein ABL78_7340 [Leptomonas seymouri]|eukprot:KPI83626.1 hypothetical protein ABL78_7340 [Leptomonas seymouri]